jgi:hypothetical protein
MRILKSLLNSLIESLVKSRRVNRFRLHDRSTYKSQLNSRIGRTAYKVLGYTTNKTFTLP